MKKLIMRALPLLLALTMLFTLGAGAYTYKDSASVAAARSEAVENMRLYGIMQGDDKNAFNPKQFLTRQEMFKIMFKLLEGGQNEPDTALADAFIRSTELKDAGDTQVWAYGYAAYNLLKGIFKGDNNGKLDPRGNLTYAQCAVVLLRALGVSDGETDLLTGSLWAVNAIRIAGEYGLLDGIEAVSLTDNTTWSKYITREDIAQMVDNCVNNALSAAGRRLGPVYDSSFHIYTGTVAACDGENLFIRLADGRTLTYPRGTLAFSSLEGRPVKWSVYNKAEECIIAPLELLQYTSKSYTPAKGALAAAESDNVLLLMDGEPRYMSGSEAALKLSEFTAQSFQSVTVYRSELGTCAVFRPVYFAKSYSGFIGLDLTGFYILHNGTKLYLDKTLMYTNTNEYIAFRIDMTARTAVTAGTCAVNSLDKSALTCRQSGGVYSFAYKGKTVSYMPSLPIYRESGFVEKTTAEVAENFCNLSLSSGQAPRYGVFWNSVLLDVYQDGTDKFYSLMTGAEMKGTVKYKNETSYLYEGYVRGEKTQLFTREPASGTNSSGVIYFVTEEGISTGRYITEGTEFFAGSVWQYIPLEQLKNELQITVSTASAGLKSYKITSSTKFWYDCDIKTELTDSAVINGEEEIGGQKYTLSVVFSATGSNLNWVSVTRTPK